MPAPLRRNRPQAEEKEGCECCGKDCACKDCERCSEEGLEIGADWIPPAKGQEQAGKRKRGK
jgi:hypothetical protein